MALGDQESSALQRRRYRIEAISAIQLKSGRQFVEELGCAVASHRQGQHGDRFDLNNKFVYARWRAKVG